MRTPLFLTLALVLATVAAAGDIHGTVACKGLRDSADAVVYVDAVPGKTFPAPQAHAKINQQSLVFSPHVLPVLLGTTVDFVNADTVLHNVFSPDACAGKFNLGTWPRGQARSHVFAKECAAAILCAVHPEMEAYVVVVPTPYFAVTAKDGSYRIPDTPDGAYVLKVWHPKRKPGRRTITVRGETEASFELGH